MVLSVELNLPRRAGFHVLFCFPNYGVMSLGLPTGEQELCLLFVFFAVFVRISLEF